MTHDTHAPSVPTWLMLLIFLVIAAALWIFGDLFIFLLGVFIEILVFAGGYNKAHHIE